MYFVCQALVQALWETDNKQISKYFEGNIVKKIKVV